MPAAPPVPAAPTRRFRRLAFRDRGLETAFQRRYTREALPLVRRATLVASLLYGPVFAVNDWLVAPHLLAEAWTLRAAVFAVGMAVLAVSHTTRFRHLWQPLVALLVALAGIGLVVLLAIDRGPVTSGFGFNGPALVIVAAYVLFRLRFGLASLAGWSVVLAFVVVALFVRDLPPGRVYGSLIFFSAANLLGMVAAYGLERYARTDFLQDRDLDARRRESLRLLDARERFFASVSHELRTPLTLVAAPLRRVLEGDEPLSAAARADLDTAARSADRLLRLVGDLLDGARLDAGRMHLACERLDVAAWLRALVGTFAPAATARGLTLDADIPGTPVWVDADAHRLDTAAGNLVANAVKFTPAGGTVRVALDASDANVLRIAVDDTGPGVADDDAPHVFERFRQGEAGERVGGTGLGLALARDVARLHGGDVVLEPTAGPGARFVLTLPRLALDASPPAYARPAEDRSGSDAEPTAPADTPRPDPAEHSVSHEERRAPSEQHEATLEERRPSSELRTPSPDERRVDPTERSASPARRRESSELHRASPPLHSTPPSQSGQETEGDDRPLVLVVDDDPDVRAFVARLLGDIARVETAPDGDAGLARTRETVPDLVVTDRMMPGLDGLALVRAIRADAATAHVPVLMLTARAGEESRLDGLASGVDDYLAKPFTPRELRARVEAAFARTARLRAHFAPAGPVAPAVETADASPLIAATPVEVTSADAAFVSAAQAAVEARLADLQLGTDLLASDLSMSRRQLERKLRALTGLTPAEFIRRLRLSRAADLLGQGYGAVADVSEATGFANASHFARVFREHFGVAPSAWRRAPSGPPPASSAS